MQTHADIIDSLGGAHELARLIDVKPVTARAWSMRNNIPAEYWPAVSRAASDTGNPINIELLARTQKPRKAA
jgi:hypothetical protein